MPAFNWLLSVAALSTAVHSAAVSDTADVEVVTVGGQTLSVPVLDGFVSYSIEFAFFPDYAGNSTHPNTFSNNLLNNIGNYTGTKPYIRVGGNTQDYAIYDPKLKVATNGTYIPSISTDYPLILYIGKSYFDSYRTWPDTKYIHGFNLALSNTTGDISLLLQTVPLVCKALRHGRLAYYELGNEPDLYRTSAQGIKRPSNWTDQDYVSEWLILTREIRQTMEKTCPRQANNATYKYYAPSNAGVGNLINLPDSFADGLDIDKDIGIISSHNYISGATSPGVTLQGTLMNHTRTIQSVAPHLSEMANVSAYGLPYIMGETNSLYNEGRPGLSNSFGAALWGVDFNLWCAANNISRVHMHQGTSYRYQSWQPVDPRNSNGTSLGTKAPYYGNILVAASLSNSTLNAVQVANLPLNIPSHPDTSSAYAIYTGNTLSRITILNLNEYNYTNNVAGGDRPQPKKRPVQKYRFRVPESCAESVGVRRLSANGSDAITGITFDGFSFNYELDGGRPVLLGNVTRGETVNVKGKGVLEVGVEWSGGVVLDLDC